MFASLLCNLNVGEYDFFSSEHFWWRYQDFGELTINKRQPANAQVILFGILLKTNSISPKNCRPPLIRPLQMHRFTLLSFIHSFDLSKIQNQYHQTFFESSDSNQNCVCRVKKTNGTKIFTLATFSNIFGARCCTQYFRFPL